MNSRGKLNLDEAIVHINKSSISYPLDVYYQIEDCFGCPLEKLNAFSEPYDNFIIGTKYNLQLELRKSGTGSNMAKCRFDSLALNSHGQYMIDVAEMQPIGLSCSIRTLDKGECMLCPFAILTCLLLAVVAIEQLVAKFRQKSKSNHDDVGSDQGTCAEHLDDPQQQQDSSPTSEVTDSMSNHEVNLQQEQHQQVPQQQQAVSNNLGISWWIGSPNTSTRVDALDAFRGLTIAGMIFVNYGGAGYVMLEHKPWDGITLADFVFPFFIFAMGASVAISTKSMVRKQKKGFQEMSVKIFRRSMVLALIGLCLNSKWLDYENNSLDNLRLTGVLQRFSISYFIVALMYTIELMTSKWIKARSVTNIPMVSKSIGVAFELLTAFNYTSIYVFVTFFLEYDSTCPIGYTGPGGLTAGGQYANCTGGAAGWLDRSVFGENHLYHGGDVKQIFKTKVSHDPEGLLGCTTSILLTLIGLQCGKVLVRRHQQQVHRRRLVALSRWVALLAVSCSLVFVIPINKRLWSLTFVLVSGLAAFVLIIFLYLLLDVQSSKRTLPMRLLISAGKNSIFLYVGHSLVANMLPWWFPIDQASHLQLLLRLSWATFTWLVVAHYLAERRIFIKI